MKKSVLAIISLLSAIVLSSLADARMKANDAKIAQDLRQFRIAAEMYYKAGEAAFALKDNEKAAELFMKSSEISFSKAFDRYGVSALEYARDCYTALGNQEKAEELTKKIKEVNQKLNQSSGSDEEQSFSVFS